MAKSPSHALGQIAGYMMEQAFFEMLEPIAQEFDLYIDRQGERQARGTKKKVTWFDAHGNKHDLDFVLEREGSTSQVGRPAAFVESAWRRYTKHSINKASEIANALVPLRQTYKFDRPFLAALVAGEWTQGGLAQMEAQGISVLRLPVAALVDAFAVEDVDFKYDEDTSDEYMAEQVEHWNRIGEAGQGRVVKRLQEVAGEEFSFFEAKLREHLSRRIESVVILPLHGAAKMVSSVSEAVALLSAMEDGVGFPKEMNLIRVEIQVRYSNTDKIDASFSNLADAILWLEQNHLPSH